MAINPWEALMYAIRCAHIVGSTKGAAVTIDDTVRLADDKGAMTLYCARERINGASHYTITKDENEFSKQVYWLPWKEGKNETATIELLDRSGAEFFLTSSMSGCHFVGCDSVVMHTAPGFAKMPIDDPVDAALDSINVLSDRLGRFGFSTDNTFILSPSTGNVAAKSTSNYGNSGGTLNPIPRALVMGWKLDKQWFFAYQDLTIDTNEHAKWKKLRG